MVGRKISGLAGTQPQLRLILNKGVNTMGVEENKETVRFYIEEVMSQGNTALLGELMAEKYVMHLADGRDVQGLENAKQGAARRKDMTPDLLVTVDEMLAEGDKVVVRGSWQGTNTKEFQGNSPTGKRFDFAYIAIYRLEEGKIIEGRLVEDMLNMYRQLGITPLIN